MNQFLMKMKSLYWRLFSPGLEEKHVRRELQAIDKVILNTQPRDIPGLFKDISLDKFGLLLLDVPSAYPNIKAFFPSMASDEVQDSWTGNHGKVLLGQSLAFMKNVLSGYYEITGRDIQDARVLDFGCGWGRLLRLLYKYVSYEQIYGIDPWYKSIDHCRDQGIKGNLAISDYVPRTIPFDVQFDLIYAFSVFTHLSAKTCAVSLSTLRKYIADNSLLVITIRPKEYWLVHQNGKFSSEMLALHDKTGFAFIPHNRPPIDGDITYGDASISVDYFERNFPQWKVIKTFATRKDVHQVLMFLRPV